MALAAGRLSDSDRAVRGPGRGRGFRTGNTGRRGGYGRDAARGPHPCHAAASQAPGGGRRTAGQPSLVVLAPGLLGFCFILGIIAVMAGVGGGVLFVPLVSGFFPFHLDFVRGAGLLVALAGALAAGRVCCGVTSPICAWPCPWR